MKENKDMNLKTNAPKEEKKQKAPKKAKLIKNQALLKRGGYAMGITAAVLAGIIVLNILVGVLAQRVNLKFDMSLTAQNSMSKENIEFVKALDKEITVTLCAKEEDYVGGYMDYYAQEYGIAESYTDYYKQTINLLEKYHDYNKKIKVEYIDTQSTEFSKISAKYPNEAINYGDIVVTCKAGDNERHKIIGYQDIYILTENQQYSSYMGMSVYDVAANNIETALTSAISYVTSSNDKKVAFITGHSKKDYSEIYRELLEINNYKIDIIDDKLVTNISSEYDALVIVAPTTDFIDAELDAIAKFLDNDGKYEKGLLFFADATAPYLPNLYEYLAQWGIAVGEGILFETDEYHLPDQPTVLYSFPFAEDEIVDGMIGCVTGFNAPVEALFDEKNTYKVTPIISTLETVVNAPVGTADDWTGAGDYRKASYATVIQSERMTYDKDNNEINNFVFVFSSTDFIYSEYAEMEQISNKNIALAAAERAVGAEDSGISFVSKVITNESYAASITQSSANVINTIFVFVIPIAILAVCIYVYIRRKNS